MRRFGASCTAVLIAAAVLAACGGGSSSKSGNPLTPGNNGGGSSSSNDLSKLVANAAKQRYKITYSDSGGDTQVYAQDGNGNSVFGTGDTETFTTKSSTITCDKSSGKYTCEQSPVSIGGVAGNPFLGVLTLEQTELSALGGRFGTKSSKTIAGRDAQCVAFSAKDLAGAAAGALGAAAGKALKASAEYCIDKDTGATLEIAGTDASGKSTTSLKVTKFETPTAGDFKPPATPSTIPGIGSITIPGGGTITIPTIPGGN